MKDELQEYFFCAYFHVREISEASILEFRVYALVLVQIAGK